MSRYGAGTQLSQTALFTFISCIVVTSSVVVTLALQDCCQQPQALICSFVAATGLVDTGTGLVGDIADIQQLLPIVVLFVQQTKVRREHGVTTYSDLCFRLLKHSTLFIAVFTFVFKRLNKDVLRFWRTQRGV